MPPIAIQFYREGKILKRISARNLFEILVLITSTAALGLAGCGGGGSGGYSVPLTASSATKMTVGNTWTWSALSTGTANNGFFMPTQSSETQTIISMQSGIATISGVSTDSSGFISTSTLTTQIDPATGNLIVQPISHSSFINAPFPPTTVLPASIGVGSSWTRRVAISGGTAAIATITAINVSRIVPAGKFDDCIQVNVASYVVGTETISEVEYFSPTVGVSVETHSYSSDPVIGIYSTYDRLLQAGYVAN